MELGLNSVEYNDKKIGVITAGICYEYAKEALGDKASYLKLGCVYPLPTKLIEDFCKECDTVYVLEELDDYIETHCRKMGLDVKGKADFTLLGEYSQGLIRKVILGEESKSLKAVVDIPARPPVLCAGCPHRGTFYVLKKLGLVVSGDIGCYTLGAVAPLQSVDTTICMGASVTVGSGIAHSVEGAEVVSTIGDSTFLHTGVNGLINAVYNNANQTVIILDNRITALTGHQPNPTTGMTACGVESPKI